MTREHDGPDHLGVPETTAPSELATLRSFEAGLEQVRRSLAAATNFREFKDARDRAESWRHYIANIRAGLRVQNEVAEIKIRAERRIGEELATLSKAKGGGDQRSEHRSHRPTSGPPPSPNSGSAKINHRIGRQWRPLPRISSKGTFPRSTAPIRSSLVPG